MKASVSIRDLVYIALFSAIFIVFSFIQFKISLSPVPISLQTLGLTLAGIFLKPKQAFISVLVSILIGIAGLPIFGGKSGLVHVLGPTGGFIVYFAFGALIISLLFEYVLQIKHKPLKAVCCFLIYYLFGSLASFVIGIPWFMTVLDVSFIRAVEAAFLPFIIGDILKAIVAVFVTFALHKQIVQIRSS